VTGYSKQQHASTLRDSHAIWIIQCDLPTDRGDILAAAFKLVLDFATPKGCKTELTKLTSYIPRWYTRPNTITNPILSFPAGSSGGPDGLLPMHLKDLIHCRESGSDFLTALAGFINLVLAGRFGSHLLSRLE